MATTWRQDAFRLSNDNGSETAATYQAALNVNGSRVVDQNIRLRFLISEQGTTAATLTASLYCQKNGSGGYVAVTGTSSNARASLSSNFVDDAATTRVSNPRALGSGTFVAGKMDELTGACTATGSIARYSETEIEFCIQLRSAELISGDYLDFRVYASGVAFATYTYTPRVIAGIALTSTAALSAKHPTFAATGTESYTSVVAVSVQHAAFAASGAETFSGTVAFGAKAVVFSASGVETFVGTGAIVVPHAIISASGTVESFGVSGEASFTAPNVSLDAVAVETFVSSVSISGKAVALAVSGTELFVGVGAFVSAHSAFSATGTVEVSGIYGEVLFTAPRVLLSASGMNVAFATGRRVGFNGFHRFL